MQQTNYHSHNALSVMKKKINKQVKTRETYATWHEAYSR